MPATLPANPGKTLEPDFLARANAALDNDDPPDADGGADQVERQQPQQQPQQRQRPQPTKQQPSRADAISDADDQTDSDLQPLNSGDDQQPDGAIPLQDWREDGDVQEMAASYGLTIDDLADFPDQKSFVASIHAMDRRQLLGGQQPQRQQAQPQQQQRQAGQQPGQRQQQQPEQQELPDEVLEKVLNAEYLDEDQTKQALRAIRDDNRMMRQVLFNILNQHAQAESRAQSDQFDQLVDTLDVADLGKGDQLTEDQVERRIQVWETVHALRQISQRNTGRTPALSKSLVERATHIAFPKVQTQKLREDLEAQSRRRLGTTVSSKGSTRKADTAEAAEAEDMRVITERWKQHQRENGNL